MIPISHLQEWTAHAPWPDLRQVEQDLIISRAICDLFSSEAFQDDLVKEVGDGSIGVYLASADGIAIPAYVHTKYLEMTLGKGFP